MFGFETAKQIGNRTFGAVQFLGRQAGQTRAVQNIEIVDRDSLHATVEAEIVELTLPSSDGAEAEAIAVSLGMHLAQLHEQGGQYTPETRTEQRALQHVARISGVLIDGQTVNIPHPRSPL